MQLALTTTALGAGATSPAFADDSAPPAAPAYKLTGYVESYYQWSFQRPSNRISNFRGFDDRSNSFTLSNVALDATWDRDRLLGHLALQVGTTPTTYYLAEPALPGASGASASNAELWKYVQQANGGYIFDVGHGLSFTAGLFLSPIGPEGIAVKDDWNWSRSNLFFGLPFYHSGARLSYPLTDAWTVTVAGYNGWNDIVDNNGGKSIAVQATYTAPDRLAASVQYFGGVERPSGAPEGRAWRHLVDAYATWTVSPCLALLGHVDAGVEPSDLGTSSWLAGALYARYQASRKLHVAVRGDAFREHVADGASPIFWPVAWVASGTATLDYQPSDHASLRLEYRHDHADGAMYFGGSVAGDGVATPFVTNRDHQDTLTLGVTSWF